MTQLTHQIPLNKHEEELDKLLEKTKNYSRELLEKHYWNKKTLEEYQEWQNKTSAPSYKFFTNQEENPLKNKEDYTYNRYQRCVFEKIGRIIQSHLEEYKAFKLVTSTVEPTRIGKIERQKIKEKLFQEKTEYIPYSTIENIIEQLNNYYKDKNTHPENYTDLVETPKPNGTLPLSPDDEQIHSIEHENNQIHFTIKTSKTENPTTYNDYEKRHFQLETYPKLSEQLTKHKLGKPTIHKKNNQHYIDIPVKTKTINEKREENKILSIDLGVKTMATSTIVQENHEEHLELLEQPEFHNHPDQSKLYNLMKEAEKSTNPQAKQVHEKEKRLRKQIQHDIANQLVLKAHAHNCKTIVLEDLADLKTPKHRTNSKKISSWARGQLKQLIEYKANLLNINLELVNPWGTSQHCPKCGSKGKTVKSSNNHTQCDSGGWFHCPSCGFEGDRDYNGALNVARVFFQEENRIVLAKPVEYTSTGKHAGFPKSSMDYRSTSVQPSTSEPLPSLTVFREDDSWKWLRKDSARGLGEAQYSVTRLAHTKKH